MPEHSHKWFVYGEIRENYISGDECHVFAECISKDKCGVVLDWEHMNRRLNAVEQLSAKDARNLGTYASWLVGKNSIYSGSWFEEIDMANAYADVLEEGENEETEDDRLRRRRL